MRTFLIAASVGIAGVATVAIVRAEASPIPVRVDVQSVELCASGFLGQLEQRDPNVRAAEGNEAAPRLTVRIARAPRGREHGSLVIQDVDGSFSRREVDGDSCESVLGALALMAVIAVDPGAPVSRDTSAPAPSATPGGATATASAPSESPRSGTKEGGSDKDAGTGPPEARDGGTTERPSSLSSSSSVHVGFGAGAGVSTGFAPTVAWVVPAFAELRWGEATRVGPLLRGGYLHGDSGDDSATGGSARFVANLGTLDVCARIPFGRGFQGLPCLHAEGGTLAAAGLDIVPARTATRPWVGVGALGAVRYDVVSVVFAELSVDLRLPLIRDRFFFEPSTTVFHPPPLALFGGASLGVTIP
jgi:hypothetical protein